MDDPNHPLNRRRVVAGLGAMGLGLAAAPALAQFNLQGLVNSAASVVQAFTMDEADEIKMGENYYQPYIQKGGGAYPDRNAQEALRKFAEPLLATSGRGFPWEVTLLANDSVNAWAIPGGKLAINSALVAHADDPAELASVIAHEIGHAELSHGKQQMRTQAFMGAVSDVGKQALTAWLGSAGPITGQVLTALEGPVFQMVNAGYSRQREFEADQHILGVFGKTGLDAGKADDFFRTLDKLYPQNSSATTSLFSTHPGNLERIARLEEAAAGRAGSSAKGAPPGWKELKERFPTPAAFRRG